MKNPIVFTLLLALFAVACSPHGETEQEVSLKNQNRNLIKAAIEKNKEINEYENLLTALEQRVNSIRKRNKPLSIASDNEDFTNSTIDQQLMIIEDFLEQSRYELAVMNDQLEKKELNLAASDKQMAAMRKHLEEQFAKADELQSALVDSNIQLAMQKEQNQILCRTVEMKEEELEKAWFAFGTFDELKEKAVIQKKGGILGLGAVKSLTPEFNKAYFTEIDIYEVTQIPIMSKKAEIITNHPHDSYKIVGSDQIEYIEILDPENFWKVSKYLTVVVK